MSSAYRIRVAQSETRTIHVTDGVQSQLEILEVVPRERLVELLAAELAKRGFERKGDVLTRTEKDGVVVEVDARAGTVTVKAGAKKTVDVKVERTYVSRTASDADIEARGNAEVKREIDRQVDDKREALRQDVSKKLEGRLRDLRAELDQVVNRVTAEGLKEKARSMGQIEEIAEDGNGNVTIKVRI